MTDSSTGTWRLTLELGSRRHGVVGTPVPMMVAVESNRKEVVGVGLPVRATALPGGRRLVRQARRAEGGAPTNRAFQRTASPCPDACHLERKGVPPRGGTGAGRARAGAVDPPSAPEATAGAPADPEATHRAWEVQPRKPGLLESCVWASQPETPILQSPWGSSELQAVRGHLQT